jgi:hypothetical protein
MTTSSIFYAWQSDRYERANHYFIRDAAEAAVGALQKQLPLEEAPRVHHDTKGVSGMPDIARVIFDKIDGCSIFLADLTFVAETGVNGKRKTSKLVPNPNVMLELGYALRSIGPERLMTVLNTAFVFPDRAAHERVCGWRRSGAVQDGHHPAPTGTSECSEAT